MGGVDFKAILPMFQGCDKDCTEQALELMNFARLRLRQPERGGSSAGRWRFLLCSLTSLRRGFFKFHGCAQLQTKEQSAGWKLELAASWKSIPNCMLLTVGLRSCSWQLTCTMLRYRQN